VTRRNPLVTSILTLYGIFVKCLCSRPLWVGFGVRRLDVKKTVKISGARMHYALKVDLHSQNRFLNPWPDQVRENVKRPHVPAISCEG